MAITAERLRVEVEADTDAATRGLQGLEREGGKIPGWAKAAGAALAGAFAADKIIGGVKAAISAASDLQQSVGGVEAVFGQNAGTISGWAATAAKELGLSQNAYNEFATVVGSQLKNMGVPMDEVTGKTADLITKGADLAATFGGTTSEAVSALSSLMRGETDPIERYGVSIKEADVQARLAAMGMSNLEGEAAKTARTTALLGLLTEQTSAAQGSFAREADTLAGGQQRLQAGFTNLVATIGGAFLPAATQVVSWASEAVDWLSARLPGGLATLSAAWSGVVALLRSGDFTSAFREATGVEEDSPFVAMLLRMREAVVSTVGEVRGGLQAMRAAFAEGGSDVTSSGIAGALEAIGLAARNFLEPLKAAFAGLGPTLGPVIGQVMSVVQAFSPLHMVMEALLPVLPQIGATLGQVAGILVSGLGSALQAVVPAITQVASVLTGALTQGLVALMPAISALLPQIATLATTLVGALLPVIQALYPVLTQVATTIIGVLVQAFTALLPVIMSLLPVVTQVASVVGEVLLVAVQALSPLITMLADVFAALVPALVPVIAAVVQVVSALAPVVSIVGDLIGALLPPLVDLFMALLQPVLDLIAPLVGALAPILTTVANIISSLLVPIIGVLADWLGRLVGFVTPVISVIAGGLVSAISTLIRWVVQAVAAIVSFAGDALAAFGRFASAAGEKVGEAIDFVAGIPGAVLGVFANAGSWLVDSGRNIIEGLIDGVKAMASRVVDAVSDVLGAARDLLPFSPAKKGPFSGKGWTLYSGRSISSALADGIRQEGRQVVAATREVAGLAAVNLPGATVGSPTVYGAGSGAPGASSGPSPADALGVGSASGYSGPSTIVVVDADGNLIGRMRVEAGKVATGQVIPLDEGRSEW